VLCRRQSEGMEVVLMVGSREKDEGETSIAAGSIKEGLGFEEFTL
jgi:hypothetical protein